MISLTERSLCLSFGTTTTLLDLSFVFYGFLLMPIDVCREYHQWQFRAPERNYRPSERQSSSRRLPAYFSLVSFISTSDSDYGVNLSIGIRSYVQVSLLQVRLALILNELFELCRAITLESKKARSRLRTLFYSR